MNYIIEKSGTIGSIALFYYIPIRQINRLVYRKF